MKNTIHALAILVACSACSFLLGRINSRSSDVATNKIDENSARSTQPDRSGRLIPERPRAHTMVADRASAPTHGPIQGSDQSGNPITTMKSVLNQPDPMARAEAWLDFIGSLDSSDCKEVLIRMKQGFTHEHFAEYSMLLGAWAKADPIAALDWAKDGGYSYYDRQLTLGIWATTDPDAAIHWAETNGKGGVANRLMIGVISGLAGTDLTRATKLLNDMAESAQSEDALQTILEYGPKLGRKEALDWVNTIDDKRLRDAAMERIADRLAYADPKGAADWLMANPGEASTSAMGNVMARMAQTDLQAAISYFQSIGDEGSKATAFAGIADQMGRGDVEAAARFIESNQSIASDQVYETLANQAADHNPVLGAQAIARIRDEFRKHQAYSNFIKNWLMTDQDAAKAWAKEQKFPEATQSMINAYISVAEIRRNRNSNSTGYDAFF